MSLPTASCISPAYDDALRELHAKSENICHFSPYCSSGRWRQAAETPFCAGKYRGRQIARSIFRNPMPVLEEKQRKGTTVWNGIGDIPTRLGAQLHCLTLTFTVLSCRSQATHPSANSAVAFSSSPHFGSLLPCCSGTTAVPRRARQTSRSRRRAPEHTRRNRSAASASSILPPELLFPLRPLLASFRFASPL